jgi:transposase
MKSDKLLRPRQLTAMQLLVSGTPASQVAERLQISVMTVYRWQRLPAFEAKLNAVTSSGLQEIARTINAASLTAAETLQEILCDLSLPVSIRMKAAVAVLGTMSSVNSAVERGLQHRVADFDLTQRFNTQGNTYDQRGESCHGTEEHITV